MKKHLYLIAAAVLAFVACAKEEAYQSTESTIPGAKRIVLGASFELPSNATKSDYDAAGNFSWSDDDAIWIGTDITAGTDNWGKGLIMEAEAEVGPGFKKAKFDCSIPGESAVTAVAAVFPTTVQPSYSDGTLSLKLPDTIAWTDTQLANPDPANAIMQVDNVMVARFADIYEGGYAQGTTNGLQFYNVGGLFCLTLKNVPAGAEKLIFTTDKKINGSFAVKNVVNPDDKKNYPQIETTSTETVSEKSITITFTTISNGENKMTFFIPVPVGSYVIGFDVQKADGTSVWKFSASKANGVERGHIVKMPTLSHVIVGGDGDGATNIITTPTSYSGTVYLPSTLNNIYVRMNRTDGTIKLEYSSAANAQHPQKVYLQALGDITALEINLPDSHVELTGTDKNNVQVVTNVTASTSINTFVVDNKVQIGKSVSAEETVGGLTINGGSLDLSAPVVGTVTVVYDPVSETVNKTSEKVSINIKSAIKDLVVTSASTQTAPDKIYVTLSSSSEVKETLSVPETNCNLYIAPGAQATTVTTSAAENTIAGEVTNLNAQPKEGASEPTTVNVTVTGQVDQLGATGEGTTVFVTEDATVTKSIAASNGATVNVDPAAIEDNNVTQNEESNGTINSDKIVAVIGNTTYGSLAAAYDAAKDGDTITLLGNCDLTESFVNEKNITIDLGDYSISGEVGKGSAAQSAEGKLIYNKGTLTINSANNKGCIWNDSIDQQGRDAIYNAEGATIVINGGIFGDSDTDMTNGNNKNRGAGIRNFGTAILNGGRFTAGDNYLNSGWAYAIINGNDRETCVLTINDGVVVYGQNNGNIAGNAGTININGGEFNITGTKSHYNVYSYNAVINVAGGTYTKTNGASGSKHMFCVDVDSDNASNPGKINVSGGSFTQNNTTTALASSVANISITGGTFNVDPTAYVATGYQAVNSGNLWSVMEKAGAVKNLAELKAAISSNTTPIYYVGEPITEAFTLAPSVETTIYGLKVNHQTVAANATTLTINGDVTLNDAEITTKAYCGISVSEGKTVTLKDCVVDGSSATDSDSRAMNINGGAVVTIDGSTIKGPATAGGSRCLNILGNGAKVDVINVSTLSVSHYAVNMPSSTVNAVVNVKNSSVNTGWAIANIWKTGNTIEFDNCVLNSLNDKKYNADGWNNFAAFVFNEGSTNNEIVVNNSQVSVRSTTGNKQYLAFFKDEDNTLTFANNTSVVGETTNTKSPFAVWKQSYSLNFDETVTLIWDGVDLMHEAAIDDKAYGTLAEAIAAATDGATITIINAGNYSIPAITKNLTIEAAVSGVVVEHTTNTTIANIESGKTATFKNITFNLGDITTATAHGFGTLNGTNGSLVMNGCTINGALNLFGESSFTNCAFSASGIYNIWAVNDDATFTGCSFTNTNRAVNVYDQKHGIAEKKVSFSNCTFVSTGTTPKKAAINIHDNPDKQEEGANYNVTIKNCTTTGTWAKSVADTGEPANATVCNNALWMVSDIVNWANGNITVTVDDAAQDVYKVPVAQIGSSYYANLSAAFEAAQDGNTITLLADCEVSEALVNTKNITLDLGSYSISGTVEAYLLQNKGTLVINADNTNPGKIYNVSTAAKGHGAVLNDTEGTITINGGIFGDKDSDHTNTGTVNSGCALRNRGTATVNSGVFTTAEPDYAGVWAYAIVSGESDVAANITINGGHIYGRHGDLCNNHGTMVINDVTTYGTANYYSIYAWKEGTTTVNGGTYVKNSHTPAVNIQFYADEATASIVVKDGNFTKNTAGNFANGSGSVSLQGGTFNKQPEAAIIADGFAAVDNGDGTWTVVEAPIEAGEGSGRTLAEAVALVKAANGGSIRMVGDDNVTSYIRVEAPTILDLNGHTITASCPLFNYVTADLTIKDSQGNGKMDVNVGTSRYGIYSSTSGVKIKLEGGTLSASSSNGSFIHAVSLSSGATFEMSGGKITVPATSTAKTTANYCIELGSGCSAVINGGEIVCEGAGNNYAIGNSGGTVTINAGSITAKYGSDNWGLATSPYVLYGSGTYTVNGGYIKAIGNEDQYAAGHFVDKTDNTSITGGYFGAVYSNWNEVSVNSTIASGYKRRVLTANEANATDAAAYAAGYQAIVEAQ